MKLVLVNRINICELVFVPETNVFKISTLALNFGLFRRNAVDISYKHYCQIVYRTFLRYLHLWLMCYT